ncbi:MAG: beta strand repeat-containing protein, partial [Stellaceae bacterium]
MRTLTGTYPNGFSPNGAFGDDPLTINSTGSISSVNDGIALDCQSPFKNFAFYWDVTNYGRITAQGFPSTGVVLQDGGSLVNGASTATGAYISGSYRGISMPDGGGAVVNYGTIAVISGLANSVGVDLPVGGNVKNFGLIRGPYTEIEIGGADGTVANYGTIVQASTGAEASAGTGIFLPEGGTVINGSSAAETALIATGAEGFGVEAFDGPGIVINSGTIAGEQGIFLNSGGTVINSGSVLGAEIAINLSGLSTLRNRGTIIGNGPAANSSAGVVFNGSTGGDFLSNAGTGDIAGTKFGVYANVGSITVVNTARIENGVVLNFGGKVTNGRSGSTRGHISGAAFGVDMPRGGTLVNFGRITGYGTAGVGVSLNGPLASTVTNGGTITGAGGTAIAFGDGNDRLIVDAGAKFDDVVNGAGGANEIDFRKTGTVHLDPEYVGFSIVRLGNGAPDRLSLSETNFTAIAGNAITVYGGNVSSLVDAEGFAGKHRLLYFGTRGKDRVTGGAGNDRFTFAAPGLTAADAIAGGGGSDTIAITTGGTLNPAGVTGVETVRLAGADADSLVLTDGNFVGIAGHTVTLFGGRAGDTIDAAKLSAANRIVVFGGRGPDRFAGGAGSDRFSVAAIGLTSADHIAGGIGSDELDLTGAGSSALAGVSGIETIRLSGAGADTV